LSRVRWGGVLLGALAFWVGVGGGGLREGGFAEPFGALEFDGEVAVAPDEIVEGADVEFFAGADGASARNFVI